MKPFRLITVERLRIRELDARAADLHAAAAAHNQALAERDRLAEQLSGGSTGSPAVGTASGAELDLANNFRQVLRYQIHHQDQRINTANGELGQARNAWLAARGQLRAVQALHERHRIAVRADQARREQRELDEHAGTRRPTVRDVSPTEAGNR